MDNSVMDNASEMSQTQTAPEPQVSEKMVPQSHVNEIAAAARKQGAERAVEEYKRQQAQLQAQQSSQYQEHTSTRNISEDDIKRVAGDEFKRHFTKLEQEAQEKANLDAANRIIGMFRDKVIAGKDKFEDFEKVTNDIEMQDYPGVVQLLAEHVDNSADVLYHLAKNQYRLYEFEKFFEERPRAAIKEFKRLADSIKSNDDSTRTRQANSPLSQQRPSNTSTESGALSMADLKRKYRG